MSSFDPSIQNTTWRRLDSIIVIIIINITPSNTFQNKSRCIFTKKSADVQMFSMKLGQEDVLKLF